MQGIGRLEDKLPENKIELCKHNDYCNIRIANGRGNCFANDEPRTCQTFRFYERYGEEWNQLGVGS